MKKFIMLSAVMAAVSTAFVACSSDDDLVQAPAVPEESVSEGTPLVINVVDATRGTDLTTSTLQGFKLFSTKTGGTTTWLTGTDFIKSGETFIPENGLPVIWQDDDPWDFYAVSHAVDSENLDAENVYFTSEEIAAASEGDPAYGKTTSDVKSGRNFTYTVPTDYANQKDLLVAAAINKDQEAGEVDIPFYHALARVEKVKVHFKGLMDASLSYPDYKFLIKNITFKNVLTTGKFTFPATWAAPDASSWTEQATQGDYTIELVDFDKDGDDIKFFDEIEDPSSPGVKSEYIPKGLLTDTERITGEPNYFAPSTGSHELPISDQGLYLLPQALSTTVTPNGSNYTLTGPYVELEGFIVVESVDWDAVADEISDGNYDDAVAYVEQDLSLQPSFTGASAAIPGRSNNYNLTHSAVMGKFYCPITTTLLPNKRYVLYIDLSSTLTLATNGSKVFSAATIKTD